MAATTVSMQYHLCLLTLKLLLYSWLDFSYCQKRTQVADLKQHVDAGISRHLAMSRELPNWLDEYETKRIDLGNVMNETTICTRRAWIREKIRNLEELHEKVIFFTLPPALVN